MHLACRELAKSREPQQVEQRMDVVLALLANGGLLESEDARGKMAVQYLPQILMRVLLARINELPKAPE